MTASQFRAALADLDLTQAQAAKLFGISLRTAHGYANGEQIPILVGELLRCLLNKKLTISDLLGKR